MEIYVVKYEDFTIGNESGLLGIYDNMADAQKRADNFSKNYIRSDARGPLGEARVVVYNMNEACPGCAAEAYEMEEMNKEG